VHGSAKSAAKWKEKVEIQLIMLNKFQIIEPKKEI
jgi:hypothetical protein